MRLAGKASRSVILLLISLMLAGVLTPIEAFGRSQELKPPQSLAPPQALTPPDNVQSVIDRAEEAFRRGEEAQAKGLPDIARKMFDQAVDNILQSGIELKTNPKLETYYRQLLDRIHKHEAQPGDVHPAEERQEVAEPALLDELSDIKEAELTTTTPGGINIFGHYDFDFSVAPPVFQFMNFFVSGRGHSTMVVGLQRSGRYRQMVEKIFKEERVPLDLIWLAQAESVWKPNALSRAAAKGIWQFIPGTGTRYGLAQTQWIDERAHPEKATRAAARYLRWLHDHFEGDWLLAMAAYNSGENRVDNAIARCGYADFWELYKRNLLPQETRNYVPIILSIIIISKNQKRYGFDVKPDPALNYETFDLTGQTDLKVVADLLSVPYEVIQDLNPELRRGASPADQRYSLKLPKGMKKQFEIAYADLPEEQRMRRAAPPATDEVAVERYRPAYRVQLASYQVRRGDTMAALARRYGVSVKEIARLNRMSSRGELRKGQTVRVPQTLRASRSSRSRGHVMRYSEKQVIRSSRHSSKDKGRSVSLRGRSSKETSSKSRSSRRRR
jgi:membrane-bound lytic murein transglycosylase D